MSDDQRKSWMSSEKGGASPLLRSGSKEDKTNTRHLVHVDDLDDKQEEPMIQKNVSDQISGDVDPQDLGAGAFGRASSLRRSSIVIENIHMELYQYQQALVTN